VKELNSANYVSPAPTATYTPPTTISRPVERTAAEVPAAEPVRTITRHDDTATETVAAEPVIAEPVAAESIAAEPIAAEPVAEVSRPAEEPAAIEPAQAEERPAEFAATTFAPSTVKPESTKHDKKDRKSDTPLTSIASLQSFVLPGEAPQATFNRALKMTGSGDARAFYILGECYSNGYGAAQNYTKAKACYQAAATRSYPEAQKAMGDLYANGWGVVPDYNQAADWYKKAALRGNAEAKRLLNKLESEGYHPY